MKKRASPGYTFLRRPLQRKLRRRNKKSAAFFRPRKKIEPSIGNWNTNFDAGREWFLFFFYSCWTTFCHPVVAGCIYMHLPVRQSFTLAAGLLADNARSYSYVRATFVAGSNRLSHFRRSIWSPISNRYLRSGLIIETTMLDALILLAPVYELSHA